MLNTEVTEISTTFPGMEVDVGLAAHAVTKALDYVGINDKSHGRRVGLICHRVAHLCGWARDDRHFILLAGMLHDCGVSSTGVHKKIADEFEWSGANEHCIRGEFFLKSFGPFSQYSEAIRYHHTRWEELPDSLALKTKNYANLIFLADRLDVIYSSFLSKNANFLILLERSKLLTQLRHYVGSLFSEELFRALEAAAQKDSFWLELQDEFLDDAIFETLSSDDHSIRLGFDEIESLGELISQIVDAKSPFTHYHSLRVADLAYELADLLGYDNYVKRLLRITGLLHDVGKLKTPDEILEKPNALTAQEFAQIRCHPLDSKRVLNSIFPNTPISKWASEHHEKLDGSGYPFGWSGDQIDMPTRVLSIADIFQALCQKRPYRDRLRISDVLEIMDTMMHKGEIDRDIFAFLKKHSKKLYQIAIKEEDDKTSTNQ